MICQNCGNSFPVSMVIEGKRRNFQNRLYCLDCSPFRKHNTKNFKKEKQYLEKVKKSKKDFIEKQKRVSFGEKLEIIAKIQEQQFLMKKDRIGLIKPWNIKKIVDTK